MNRRGNLVHDPHEIEARKDANLNPDEGSEDDLTIEMANPHGNPHGRMDSHHAMVEGSPEEERGETAAEEQAEDMGLAPSTHQMVSPSRASSDQPEESLAHKLFVPSDEGKPGIRGKVAAKMKAAMLLKGKKT